MERMSAKSGIQSVDIPQADDLATIRRVVEAASRVGPGMPELEVETGYSDRHIRYRIQAARTIGLLNATVR
jgi:hypothetical protein